MSARHDRESRTLPHEGTRALAVVVAGGANVDLKVQTSTPPTAGISTPGRIRISPGGAARNVAEALARMGAAVRLLSAVGRDPWGEWLLAATAAAGVDCAGVVRSAGQTGLYVVLDGAGVSDTTIIEAVEPATWAVSSTAGSLLVLDANLNEASLLALAASATRLALIGTSPTKVLRLRPVLERSWLICLTAAEAAALTAGEAAPLVEERGPRKGEVLARAVRAMGTAHVLLTEGTRGLGLLAEEWRSHPARQPEAAVETTGAGDVAAAAAIFGLATEETPERILAAAAEASALAVAGWGNVPPEVGTVWKRA